MSTATITKPQASTPTTVTGVQLARGVGVQQAKGFWGEAWSRVLKRRAAVAALVWVGIVACFAVYAPILASGHPIYLRESGPGGRTYSPLLRHLSAIDIVLLVGVTGSIVYVLTPIRSRSSTEPGADPLRSIRAARARSSLLLVVVSLAIVALAGAVRSVLSSNSSTAWITQPWGAYAAASVIGCVLAGFVYWLLAAVQWQARAIVLGLAVGLAIFASAMSWKKPLERFDYLRREASGEVRATYTLIPWSPAQRFSELSRIPPGSRVADVLDVPPDSAPARRHFLLGTDAFGVDVLSLLLHACRISISIGLVSTGIALLIGVTMGALMGYFGGWVDLLLYRVVEVFMAVPVLFLLIVAVSVLPNEWKTTYTMMAIIGLFTWTGMARFTRAEFLKLRKQDFVQSAQAVGLPLRSVLFKHMLPNGVAPVLVDTSFAVAAAITIEAVLSYLGLSPEGQPSWGRLLASAINPEGEFKWWLAVFPGAAIFVTVLSYNLIGETLRDAIDPKLKKARV